MRVKVKLYVDKKRYIEYLNLVLGDRVLLN